MYSTEVKKIKCVSLSLSKDNKNRGLFHLNSDCSIYSWVSCRDAWNSQRKENLFFFCHPDKQGPKISEFIRIAEEKLKLKKFIQIGPTQFDFVSWVQPTTWWQCSRMRYSLLTALLRCGIHYNKNWNKALYSTSYTKNTKEAVERFFAGNRSFIKPKGYSYTNIYGWENCFHGKKSQFLESTLLERKPKKENK